MIASRSALAPGILASSAKGLKELERAKGIEPSYEAWEASVLPLNYARDFKGLGYFGKTI